VDLQESFEEKQNKTGQFYQIGRYPTGIYIYFLDFVNLASLENFKYQRSEF
jgi:hypothetical protein